ncbi:MAG: hypothetical protein HFF56_09150 [Lawsonibacter sp.]|nr:hypothetical protein [Lawsonibacter sp.]
MFETWKGARWREIFSPDEANLTQEYWMYFKKNWQSMVEKEPAFGHADVFPTSPNPVYIAMDLLKSM